MKTKSPCFFLHSSSSLCPIRIATVTFLPFPRSRLILLTSSNPQRRARSTSSVSVMQCRLSIDLLNTNYITHLIFTQSLSLLHFPNKVNKTSHGIVPRFHSGFHRYEPVLILDMFRINLNTLRLFDGDFSPKGRRFRDSLRKVRDCSRVPKTSGQTTMQHLSSRPL